MTTQTIVKAYQSTLATTVTTSLVAVSTLTTATTGKFITKEILLANTDSSARTATVYGGASATVGTTIVPTITIPPFSAVRFGLSTVMNQGDSFYGGASAVSVVAITISGTATT